MRLKPFIYYILIIIGTDAIIFFIYIGYLGYYPLKYWHLLFTAPLVVIIFVSFIIWCVKVITRNVMPEKVVKGIISTSVEGTLSYQCGTCGKKNEFFAIEISENLFVCSNCREYNLFEKLD
jgi:DNA-directed RNA polymerase subunit RPC12/RpoP